ncbi:hypothetical protein EDB81DRAFT_846170 [Dactylonectria macrodidyma]|uniref:Uncharacterized protein n=1 Tax=Dactylonectria macrodidyma TaxID=307937 RepID=A0A9P9DZJ3_9HYPO|nr:hypothetical protein EDB81DRAFT_846170 [Dactylonectria macrodidyma]
MSSSNTFNIDLVARTMQKSLLNPFLTIPIAIAISWPSNCYRVPSPYLEILERSRAVVYTVTILSVVLAVTDFLNHGFHNNWTKSSNWKWHDEVVVITGGSSGIGASVAQQLYSRNRQTKIVIVDYVPLTWKPPNGSLIHYYQCDLSNSANIRPLCDRIRNEIGHPTVLINNAGLCRGFTVCDGSYADVEITIRTNLIAPFLLVKEFLPEMALRDHGHIFQISSMSALLPPARVADYAATKAGLMALHEALQLELKNIHNAPRVRSSVAILSFVRTPLFKGETKQSQFFFPLLDVETVSTAIVQTLYSGYGKVLFLPGIMRYVAILKGGPEWLWHVVREGTKQLGVDFKGRQKIDSKTGDLLGSCTK